MPRQRIRRRVGNGSVLMGNGVFETPSPTPCTLLCRAKREAVSPFSLPTNIIKRNHNQLRYSSLHHHCINTHCTKNIIETTTIPEKPVKYYYKFYFYYRCRKEYFRERLTKCFNNGDRYLSNVLFKIRLCNLLL